MIKERLVHAINLFSIRIIMITYYKKKFFNHSTMDLGGILSYPNIYKITKSLYKQ
jgi:hypothetical protein